jgi:hypothetical protein
VDAQAVRAGFIEDLLNKSTQMDPKSGQATISGMRLAELVRQQERVLRSLKVPDEQMTQLRRLAHELSLLERQPDVQVGALMEDTTSRLLEMVGALIGSTLGSQTAQRVGGGSGQSIVLSGRGSTDVRGFLGRILSDRARRRYESGFLNRNEYLRSLTGPTTAPRPPIPPSFSGRGVLAPITGSMGQTVYDEATGN